MDTSVISVIFTHADVLSLSYLSPTAISSMRCWGVSGSCESYPRGWGCCETLTGRCRWLYWGHKLQASLEERDRKQTNQHLLQRQTYSAASVSSSFGMGLLTPCDLGQQQSKQWQGRSWAFYSGSSAQKQFTNSWLWIITYWQFRNRWIQ